MAFIQKYIVFIFIICSLSAWAQNSTLKVVIKNIERVEGRLFLKLSADSIEFNTDAYQDAFVIEKDVVSGEMVFNFTHLKDGEYALSVFQDLNNNAQLDMRKFGIPAEPFAFSNAALRRFGAPYFSQAKFEVDKSVKNTQELYLIYKKPAKSKKKDKKPIRNS